jgi:hypothetical protein
LVQIPKMNEIPSSDGKLVSNDIDISKISVK